MMRHGLPSEELERDKTTANSIIHERSLIEALKALELCMALLMTAGFHAADETRRKAAMSPIQNLEAAARLVASLTARSAQTK